MGVLGYQFTVIGLYIDGRHDLRMRQCEILPPSPLIPNPFFYYTANNPGYATA
jgi:hypothetical protein